MQLITANGITFVASKIISVGDIVETGMRYGFTVKLSHKHTEAIIADTERETIRIRQNLIVDMQRVK